MTELESRTYILLLFVYLVWEVKIRMEIWFEQLSICYSGISIFFHILGLLLKSFISLFFKKEQ